MGIREEIEKLKNKVFTDFQLIFVDGYSEALDDALSILDDKWEYVEGEWQRYGYMYYDDGESLASFGASICELIRFRLHSEEGHADVEINPGDHIIILRRKNER